MSKLTAYEEQRLKNIERNRKLLADFDIDKARSDLLDTSSTPASPTPTPVKQRATKSPINKRKQPVVQRKRRQSSRLRGIEAPTIEVNEDDRIEPSKNEQSNSDDHDDVDEELWDGKLIKADDYFDKATRDNAVRTDGKFTGWINADLIEKYQFEMSAQEAWEKNGGGKFSYKDPLGNGTKRKTGGTGRNSAKVMYYIHIHEQWTGDWTDEEKELFMKVTRKYGCGDKWGLFASYIPHRVGYQCSNYYRSIILPSGIVFDDNYEYSPSGKPFYVGPFGTKSS
ncbi:hypothetical protein BCR42DRAFT_413356 [Absidia repens]|uniref:DNA damage-binding protein CMR1 n=1 Tax=Absidia repens TaxID=90262 RepID=A0A1X2IHR6_9FUNG|nr:hypothetical protein BCR42DRAFT_413356 [Absidia repens]